MQASREALTEAFLAGFDLGNATATLTFDVTPEPEPTLYQVVEFTYPSSDPFYVNGYSASLYREPLRQVVVTGIKQGAEGVLIEGWQVSENGGAHDPKFRTFYPAKMGPVTKKAQLPLNLNEAF